MKGFPLKKMAMVSGLCLTMLAPAPVAAYQGVITGENISYQGFNTFYQKQETEKIANGVEHIKIGKLTGNGWVDIHVLKAQMQTAGLELKTLRSDTWKKKETLKEMADKSIWPVLGAVNASYFGVAGDYSESQGFEFDQGLVHLDERLRPGLFEDLSGKLFISHAQKLSLVDAGSGQDLEIPLKAANNLPGAEGASIYNNKVYQNSKGLDDNGAYYKVYVRDHVIRDITSPYTAVDFPAEGYTLVFSAENTGYLEKLTVGRRIQVKTESGIALDWLKLAIPGGGYVLQNGEIIEQGELVQPGKRHPRTALGVNAAQDTLYMVVVDGRGSSIGATHYELAEYLKELGITDAVAMDGGGSSVLLARNLGDLLVNVENTLPGNHQRKLINGLAVVSTEKTGEARQLIITAEKSKTFANLPVKLEIRAIDANQQPVPIDQSQVVWSVSGVNGTVQTQQFTATSAGKAEIHAYFGQLSGKVSIEVTDNPIDLQAVPNVLEVVQGQSGSFQLWGTDSQGFVGQISPKDVKYQLEDETVGYFTEGIFVPSKKGGSTRVTITAGKRSTIAYVVAGSTVKALPELLVQAWEYQVEGSGQGSVKPEKNFGYQDLQSMSFAYYFPYQENADGQDSASKQKLVMKYLTAPVIAAEPENLSLQLYGNGGLVRLTIDLQDSAGTMYQVPLADGSLWQDWQLVNVKLPRDMGYPVQIIGFTLENLDTLQNQAGQIYLDDFSYVEKLAIQSAEYEEFPNDPLRKSFQRPANINVFGATGGRNRILDTIILQKAIANMKDSALGIYAGLTDLPADSLRPVDHIWNNTYQVYDSQQTRIIHLAAQGGSFKNADPQQFAKLAADLSNTVMNNIIVVSDVHPLEEVKNKREAGIIHEMLSRYAQSSGKNVYYLAATGYQTDVTLKDGVRYIKTNGLWYRIKEGRQIDLNRKFYQIGFYLEGDTLYYDLRNLYPLVE